MHNYLRNETLYVKWDFLLKWCTKSIIEANILPLFPPESGPPGITGKSLGWNFFSGLRRINPRSSNKKKIDQEKMPLQKYRLFSK